MHVDQLNAMFVFLLIPVDQVIISAHTQCNRTYHYLAILKLSCKPNVAHIQAANVSWNWSFRPHK